MEPDIIVGFASPEDAAATAKHIPDAKVTHNILYVENGDPEAIEDAASLENIDPTTYEMSKMASEGEE